MPCQTDESLELRPALEGFDARLEVLSLTDGCDSLAGIPAPLGIGTLTLADGSSVAGFICEQYAVHDAEDITRYGGWRAYLEQRTA